MKESKEGRKKWRRINGRKKKKKEKKKKRRKKKKRLGLNFSGLPIQSGTHVQRQVDYIDDSSIADRPQ